jgi:3-methyl-2-oxobutanoate hydroxymethyltransferase
VKRLADDSIPVIGHVGLIPSRATWTGGFRAVGTTAAGAMQIMQAVRRYEAAGAIGAEIEVVPVEVAQAISARTSLIMLSMGAGTGCDAQYLFAEDILGQNRGHMPRHSKVYRNFAAEYDRLQAERATAFSEYAADVRTGAYPEDRHVVHMDPGELRLFLDALA